MATIIIVSASAAASSFPWRGVDFSQLATEDANGTRPPFRRSAEDNVTVDALVLLKQSGANSFRMRMWNSPCADGRCDPQEYSYANLAGVLTMARRCRAAGLQFILDFHFSDWWADPGQQRKPEAWLVLGIDDLVRAVRQFTSATMRALVAQGTPPHAVQVGNEIKDGMLWSNVSMGQKCYDGGRLYCSDDSTVRPIHEAWATLGRLVAAGVSAVRAASPTSLVAIHTAGNHISPGFQYLGDWYANMSSALASHGVGYDLVGLSLYPKFDGGATFSSVAQLPQLAQRLPATTRIYLAETAFPAVVANSSKPPPEPGYTASEDGQLNFLRDLQSRMASALGDDRNGGIMWWEGSESCWDCLFGSGYAPDTRPKFIARPALLRGFLQAPPVPSIETVEGTPDATSPTFTAASTSSTAFRCVTDGDCELLGKCDVASGVCTCAGGFSGPSCGKLHLAPADGRTGGLAWPDPAQHASRNASAWGFTAVRDPADESLLHAVVNVGCGATQTHVSGSFMAHLSGNSSMQPTRWRLEGAIAPTTSFNPHLVYVASERLFVLYFRVNGIESPQRVCSGSDEYSNGLPPHARAPYIPACGAAVTVNSTGCVHPGDPERGVNIYVAWAPSMRGPWRSQNISITGAGTLHKSNPSAVALPDGRVLLSFRFNLDGEQVGFAIGDTFRGPFRSVSNLSHTGGNDEDSYLWQQPDGTLHVVFHNGPHGHHAFATGTSRTAANFSFVPSPGVSGNAFELDVQWSNGSHTEMRRRERPEILFGRTGLPDVLFTAVQQQDGRSYSLGEAFAPEGAAQVA